MLIVNGQDLPRVNLDMDDYYSVLGFEQLRFLGSEGSDTVTATNGDDTLSGGAGNDFLYAGSRSGGNDIVYGGSGDDIIGQVGFSDTVSGGAGYDIAYVDLIEAPEGIVLGRGNHLPNFTGIEEYGGYLTQHDDIFYSSSITPEMHGRWGNDRIVLDHSWLPGQTSRTVVRLDSSALLIARYVGDVSQGAVLLQGWEDLHYTGSRGSDSVAGYLGDDVLRGMRGNDTLVGGGGDNLLFGGAGQDHLIVATGGVTTAHGDIGHDLFTVRGTGHQLFGGAGDDVFQVSAAGNRIDGGSGFDRVEFDFEAELQGVAFTVQGTAGTWSRVEQFDGTLTDHDDTATLGFLSWGSQIDGGAGNDTLILNYSGAGLASSLTVDGGSISIRLANGKVTTAGYEWFETVQINGTAGDDTMQVSAYVTRLYGNDGDDRLTGGTIGNDLLDGGDGNDTLDGDCMGDTLYGGRGHDLLLGADGHDLIQGGEGADSIAGELGNDHIFGGLGADLFYFAGWTDSGNDRIEDYAEGSDQIWISGGLRARDVVATNSGADKLLTWDMGSVLLTGMAGQSVRLYFDADFL